MGELAAFANLGLVWGIMRPATRSRHPAVAACVFAALAAVHLSLNASVVFDWSLLTLAYTGHAFVLCLFLACWWAFNGTTPGRLALPVWPGLPVAAALRRHLPMEHRCAVDDGRQPVAGGGSVVDAALARWPALLGCVAIALLLLQLPLSRHSWSGARYRSANQQRTALSLGTMARRAMRGEAGPSSVECQLQPQCKSEVVRFLKANRLNVFSPAFQARNRLYPDARALPRWRPKRVRGGVQHLVQPVVQPDP